MFLIAFLRYASQCQGNQSLQQVSVGAPVNKKLLQIGAQMKEEYITELFCCTAKFYEKKRTSLTLWWFERVELYVAGLCVSSDKIGISYKMKNFLDERAVFYQSCDDKLISIDTGCLCTVPLFCIKHIRGSLLYF